MSELEPVRKSPLSCKRCGMTYDYGDLAAGCEAADAMMFDETVIVLHAERPKLWAEHCDRCRARLPWEQIAEHRRSWSEAPPEDVPAPLCDACLRWLGLDADGDAADLTDDETGGEWR